MKKQLITLATLALAACQTTAPTAEASASNPDYQDLPRAACAPSCVLDWKYIKKEFVKNPQEFLDVEGDSMVYWLGYTTDGRDFNFSRERFDSLQIGDIVPGCSIDPEIVCQEVDENGTPTGRGR